MSNQAKAVHGALFNRQGQEVLSLAEFSERLFPPPTQNAEDIQRQLDAAQNQFYEARHSRAEQLLDSALQEISRLPVGASRWQIYTQAQFLHALNYRAAGKLRESDAAFRSVLRLEPQHTLDASLYAPSIRQAFEKVKGELARTKKMKLAVKSTLPASDVYLDGLKAGQTPLTLELLPGVYELTIVKDSAVSFPRRLHIQSPETPIFVDLAYEGSVSDRPFPCLASTGQSDEHTLSHAVRLGGTLGVEEVIVVRLERSSNRGPKWLAATVLHVEGGQKLREGGLKVQGLEASPESLSALVDFVTTGKAPPPLVVPSPQGTAPWTRLPATDAPLSNASRGDFDVSAPNRFSEDGLLSESAQRSRPPALRKASYAVLGGGAAALAAAGILRLMAQKDLDTLQKRLNARGRIDASDTESLALRNSLSSKNTLLTGLLIGSGAALTTGAVLFLVSPPRPAPPPVSLDVSVAPEGASANLLGRF
ncbi:PEGA domain-containing protein [Stigmatella erecta]|uniref:PEGA domain-containing protein n=1 Tax=Stigmatella erecta TaxID=83460 RepID=A0A1I0IUU1_9BACT|nr:PEGA domain-containing protein [Stigmatella erecta]SEU01048.1 PEGA domain-containing protein [Stigmatella erecta]